MIELFSREGKAVSRSFAPPDRFVLLSMGVDAIAIGVETGAHVRGRKRPEMSLLPNNIWLDISASQV